jgi:hypothetical protein
MTTFPTRETAMVADIAGELTDGYPKGTHRE